MKARSDRTAILTLTNQTTDSWRTSKSNRELGGHHGFRSLMADLTETPTAALLAAKLDRSIPAFKLGGAKLSVYREADGAIVFEIGTPLFRLSFTLEVDEGASWWGLATHNSTGLPLASGPLSLEDDLSAPLSLILPRRTQWSYRTPASEDSENATGITLRTA